MPNTNDRRTRANRENAKKSTGPRTTEGKAKSSMNALKHGLLANSVVVPDCPDLESQEQFNELLESISDEYSPVGVIEQLLVETIAVSYWRLRRALRLEAGEIAERVNTYKKWHSKDPIERASLPTTEKTHMILRYETIIERRLNRATTRLEHLQQKRQNNRVPRLSASRRSGCLQPDNRVAPSNSFGGDSPIEHSSKPNEPNPPQTYAPSFLKQPEQPPKTTPAGYVGYQPCKMKENR